jgi:hypothetical protein
MVNPSAGEPMYVTELRARLTQLQAERVDAEEIGLTACDAYIRDLDAEISECRAAFVGAAVTEIAVARAELSGRPAG